jgi:hypothetical protein
MNTSADWTCQGGCGQIASRCECEEVELVAERDRAIELQGTAEARMQEAQMRQIGLREERDRLQSDLTALRGGVEAEVLRLSNLAGMHRDGAAGYRDGGSLGSLVAAELDRAAMDFDRSVDNLQALLPSSISSPLEPGES